MPRPFYPHTLGDVIRAVDGGLGLVAADMPDGSLWVLQRRRRRGDYAMTHYADTARSSVLQRQAWSERRAAINAFAKQIQLGEQLP